MSRYLRIPDVMLKTGLGKSTIWAWVKQGKFPSPIKLSPRVTVWNEKEVLIWINNKLKH